MDKLDVALLKELMRNSRIPITKLSKKLKASREVITYRINRLKEDKIILSFITELDLKKLGYVGAAVFINIKATRQKEFKKFIEESSFVSWVAELSGIWSFGLSIIGKTNEELDEKFLQIYKKFKDAIIDYRFTLHKCSLFFYEKYFGELPEFKSNKKDIEYKIDEKDRVILQELARNSRIRSIDLSKKTSLTIPAVIRRIKRLELGGYIKKYSIFVDVSKLGMLQYSVFVINKEIDEKEKLVSYLMQHNNVSFIAEYIGDPFVEFGVFSKDPYELRIILQKIEEAFPNNRVIEISLFQKEFVSVEPPRCVFESKIHGR